MIRRPTRATRVAYRATRYRVDDGPQRIDLVVGARNGRHERWLRGHSARSATVLTAWNPAGRRASAADNAIAQARLRRQLDASGLATLPSSNLDPSGRWPAEPGWCVFDASPRQIDRWLARFRQHAAVRLVLGRGCRLVWHPAVRRRIDTVAWDRHRRVTRPAK